MDYDVVVIGAGVVGLACAERLSGIGYRVLVVERHDSFGMETSSRNSEVIHAGIYYPKNSLKAKLCVSGRIKLYEWCRKHGVPHNMIGKYIVAVNSDEEEELGNIYERGRGNGVEGLEYISSERLSSIEPYIISSLAVWSPYTGIVDSHRLMKSFESSAAKNDCDFAYRHCLTGIRADTNSCKLEILDPDNQLCRIESAFIVNSAGLDSDIVAEMAGIDTDRHSYRLNYSRGHYFRVSPGKKYLAGHLIYPVPPKDRQSLGIHITIDMEGQLKLGPDTEELDSREQDYRIPAKLQQKFYKAASRYIKGLEPEDLSPDQSGIRPKLQKAGEDFRDFIINRENELGLPGLINLIGIESPGLTCCLEISGLVAELIANA